MPLSYLPVTGWIQIAALVGLIVLLAPPIGFYMARILQGERGFLAPILGPIERGIYHLSFIDPDEDMDAKTYFEALAAFSVVSFLFLVGILFLQVYPSVSFALAFETSISLLTGTNWQSGAPEIYFTNNSQQFGFVIQNFLSCAVALAVMAAFSRGVSNKDANNHGLGNFWADLTRITLYVLLPLSVLFAMFFVSQGVIQTFDSVIAFQTLESGAQHYIKVGPVATQAAIKQLGTNGGGFFMANAAHPFANPTPLSDFFQIIALLILPAASVFTFARMVKDIRHGWTLLGIMLLVFIISALIIFAIEHAGNPFYESLNIHTALGNMEGKELRFSSLGTALFATAAGATSGGSLNSSLDSFMPLSSFMPLILMQFGEIIFGGAGTGLTNMISYALFAVFTACLMIGRAPMYQGKKIGVVEITMVSLITIIPAFLTLTGTAIAVLSEAGQSGATHSGPHGFTQIFYAFTSASNNNGSSMGGINASSTFYHYSLGIAMLLGRMGALWTTLQLAGAFVKQAPQAKTTSMFRTDTLFFVIFLLIIIFLSMLPYVPALALGPIAEHLTLGQSL